MYNYISCRSNLFGAEMLESLLILCMALIGGDDYANCEWEMYIIEDHDTFYSVIEFMGANLHEDYNTIGITFFDTKQIFVSGEFIDHTDIYGFTPVIHEYIHAYLYEQNLISNLKAIYIAEQLGVNVNVDAPWRFHE